MTSGAGVTIAAGTGPAPNLVARWRRRRGLLLEALGEAWLPWLTARVITLFALGLAKYEVKHFHIIELEGGAGIARRTVGVRRRLVPDHRRPRLRSPPALGHSLLPIASPARPRTARHHLTDGGHRLPSHHESGRTPAGHGDLRARPVRVARHPLGSAGGLADHVGPASVRLRHGLLGGVCSSSSPSPSSWPSDAAPGGGLRCLGTWPEPPAQSVASWWFPPPLRCIRSWPSDRWGRWPGKAAVIVSSVAGTVTYLAWVKATSGGFLEPLKVQQQQAHHGALTDPVSTISHSLAGLAHGHHIGDALHVPWIAVAAVLLVIAFWRLPASYGAFALCVVAVALSGSNLDSFERYALSAFPLVDGGIHPAPLDACRHRHLRALAAPPWRSTPCWPSRAPTFPRPWPPGGSPRRSPNSQAAVGEDGAMSSRSRAGPRGAPGPAG